MLYGTLEQLAATTPRRRAALGQGAAPGRLPARAWLASIRWRRIDPLLAGFTLGGLILYALGTWHFHNAFGSGWLLAAYFVLSTMTTTGYGDITPAHGNPGDIVIAMMLMLSGIVLTGIFIGFAASLLTQARWVRMQGLRRIRRRGHIVVCGAGSIGSGVIDLLIGFGHPLVVVERSPDASLIERARDQGFDLLTGDASRDETLDLCNLAMAHSLVALTNVDTLNLEIALGGRVRKPDMPVVLRIADGTFAASIASHFAFETTFSAEALAAQTFAGLSRLPGARGRVTFAGQEFGIGELVLTTNYRDLVPDFAIPLAVSRDSELIPVRGLDRVASGDRLLMLIPRALFIEGGETLSAVADRLFPVAVSSTAAPGADATAGNH
ncbi:MAG: potassium channel family protein [Stellaceae bacterium]